MAIKKDGTEFIAEVYLAHFEQGGQPITAAFITDISERKKIEDQLKVQEHNMRLFIAHTAAAVAMFDTSMRYMIVSNRWLKDYNIEETDVIGRSHYEVFPEISAQWKELHQRGLAGEELHCDEDFFYRANGTVNWIRWQLFPWYNADNTVGGIIIFTEDITERKQHELKLRQLNEELEKRVTEKTSKLNETMQQLEKSELALQQNVNYQNLLFDNIAALIMSVDAQGYIKTMNKQAEKELGYSEQELAGKFTPIIFQDPEMTARTAAELSKKTGRKIIPDINMYLDQVRSGKPFDSERVFVRKDGTRFPVRLAITPLLDEENNFIGAVAVARNIAEQKNNEKILTESLSRERELNELKSRFVTMASHEFRTPLSTVLSSAYLIEKYTTEEDQPKRLKHLQRIITSVNMLSDILNDFLSVGKIEEGRIQVRPAWFSIKDIITDLSVQLKHTLKKGQKIKYDHSGEEQVYLDESLIKHIVMNLVSNASKFSGEGTIINIRTDCKPGATTLSVKDKGIGITKDDQKHLMERFFRGANVTNIQGTGLGLHIVAKYAELMNGTVQCISELEKGTEFIVSFTPKTVLHEKDTAD
jgi:PAS domain S-box-containing protein